MATCLEQPWFQAAALAQAVMPGTCHTCCFLPHYNLGLFSHDLAWFSCLTFQPIETKGYRPWLSVPPILGGIRGEIPQRTYDQFFLKQRKSGSNLIQVSPKKSSLWLQPQKYNKLLFYNSQTDAGCKHMWIHVVHVIIHHSIKLVILILFFSPSPWGNFNFPVHPSSSLYKILVYSSKAQ